MKYINADKLIAKIERLKSVLADPLCSQGNILGPDWVAGGNKMLKEISSVIDSLQQEQPEVDLEKAAQHVYESWMGGTMDDVRRDMVELGKVLNARK